MFSRAELNFKSRACVAQLKLRVIVWSMMVALPAWIGLAVLQWIGLGSVAVTAARIVGGVLLIVYLIGLVIVIRRTQRDHGLVCPHCGALLGAELRHVRPNGECASCDAVIVKL